jgi:hypothetical protein
MVIEKRQDVAGLLMYNEHMQRKIMWVFIIVLLGIIAFLSWELMQKRDAKTVTPARAIATSTVSTTSDDTPLSASVLVTSPHEHTVVGSDFTISGKAPGPWFFEATFPVKILDSESNSIATSHATASGDWQTTGLVDFTVPVHINGYHGQATIVLMRDNPSGLPENDDALEVPITIQ